MPVKLPKKRVIKTPATAWKRIAAFIIDFFIIQVIIIGPFSASLESIIPTSSDVMANYQYLMNNNDIITQISTIMLVIFGLIYAYFVLFDYKLKQTPGRKIMNITLGSADEKIPVTLWQVLLRNIAAFPIIPFSLLWVIDPFYLIITGQRITDQLSKTTIYEEVAV